MQFGIKHGLVAVTVFLFLWVPLKPQVKLVTEQCRRMARAGETFQPPQLPAAPQLFVKDIYGLNLTHSNLPGKGESLTGS